MRKLITSILVVAMGLSGGVASAQKQKESLEEEFQFRFDSQAQEAYEQSGQSNQGRRPQRDPSSQVNKRDVETFRGPGGSGPLYWRFKSPEDLSGSKD